VLLQSTDADKVFVIGNDLVGAFSHPRETPRSCIATPVGLRIASGQLERWAIALPVRFTKWRVEQKIILSDQSERPALRDDGRFRRIIKRLRLVSTKEDRLAVEAVWRERVSAPWHAKMRQFHVF
jgi:hypothetical protein